LEPDIKQAIPGNFPVREYVAGIAWFIINELIIGNLIK
jgi:hypothetical protein